MEINSGEKSSGTQQGVDEWVYILLMVVYWIFTLVALIIFSQVLRGMLVRAELSKAKAQSERRVTLKNRGTCHYLCCKIHSLKLFGFYFFAILTVFSRALLKTL
jgi:hypothetical protein